MNVLIEVLAFAVAIGVLVVVHEYGHYSVARLCGVKVLRFSIGFGKPLVQWVSPKTGTEWTIAALPLGGYVKMLDEREVGAPIAPTSCRTHSTASRSRRFAIVAAGPIANFLLAIVLFAAVFATGVTNRPPSLRRRLRTHPLRSPGSTAARRSSRCATRTPANPKRFAHGRTCAGSCWARHSIIAASC
jgi:RIP metalloprotease RseP